MDPDKLRKAALDLGASDGRLLLQMGIYDAVQVAKAALRRLGRLYGPRDPLEVAVNADLVARNRILQEEVAAMKAAFDEQVAEFKEFRRRLLGVLKPVGIEKGLLDIELAAVRTQELATALAKIERLEAGIAAYRKRSAEADSEFTRCDLDDADAWEASLIDVDGKPPQNS
jgi:hypothetical protein